MSFLRHRQTHLSDLTVVGATSVGAPTLIDRDESAVGYSSVGCSPAEPASASPTRENLVERTRVVQRIVSGTFLREATNRRSGPFLREATGRWLMQVGGHSALPA